MVFTKLFPLLHILLILDDIWSRITIAASKQTVRASAKMPDALQNWDSRNSMLKVVLDFQGIERLRRIPNPQSAGVGCLVVGLEKGYFDLIRTPRKTARQHIASARLCSALSIQL